MVVVNLLHVGKIAMVRAVAIAIFAPAAVKTVVSIDPSVETNSLAGMKVGMIAIDLRIAVGVRARLMALEILTEIAAIARVLVKVVRILTDQN
jgi:hypothetical protein